MFKAKNFCHIASNNRNNVKVGVFTYRTTDDLASVLVSGYFNERIIDINLHDLIIHEKIDAIDNTKVQRNLLCVVQRTLDNVGTAVIKSKWEGDIEQAIADLQTYVEEHFVRLDGSNIMTAPLRMIAGSMRGAVAPYWTGVGFFKVNTDAAQSVSLVASIDDQAGFMPATNNTLKMGGTNRKWKDLYLGGKLYVPTINNGGDLAVPAVSGTLATKADVDDAANSGEQLYATGVWYAKMYAGTTPPASAEVEGRNYADFSQVDGEGDPIIVVYTYTSGAWTTTTTITPPKNHNGYMTITSKIWDISEQSGQQGGLVLWAHNQGTFTPYPRIVSFEDAALTGTPTTPNITGTSPSNQIANKDYVDNAVALAQRRSLNMEVIGNLSGLYDGDITGFNPGSKYLIVSGLLDLSRPTDSYIIDINFTTGSTLSSSNIVLFSDLSGSVDACKLEKDSSNYVVLNGTTSSLQLQPNTKYYLRISNNLLLQSTDEGQTYQIIATATSVSGTKGYYYFCFDSDTTFHAGESRISINTISIWQGMDAPGLHTKVSKGHEVIDFQAPTADNNYTWYRKYADGWVEQGGIFSGLTNGANAWNYIQVSLLVEMSDTNYVVLATDCGLGSGSYHHGTNIDPNYRATTSFRYYYYNGSSGAVVSWQVSGMAA